MKHLLMSIVLASSLISCASCNKNSSPAANNSINNTNATASKMKINIGNKTFNATLYDNPTATAFKSILPMKINMSDLNGNEKYFDLPNTLPSNVSIQETIRNGDLMLYGSSTLVLFYKTFSTSYSYTKLGRIDDVTGLVAALGARNVMITYELQ